MSSTCIGLSFALEVTWPVSPSVFHICTMLTRGLFHYLSPSAFQISTQHIFSFMVFPVSITSSRRVSELQALLTDTPFTVFHKDKVSIKPRPKFMSKVLSPLYVQNSM
uniref:Uncharacterized protein n=1 Tax=Chrysemys picta bellii TaxID=8478 RepID=A0A8C3IRM7_CHRPI